MLTPYLRVQQHWHRRALLQEYERKFAELPDDHKLSKLCSDAVFLQEIVNRQFFITTEEGSEVM